MTPSQHRRETQQGGIRLLLRLACVMPALALLMSMFTSPGTAQPAPDLPAKKDQLRGLQDTLTQSSDQRRKLETEIELIRNDRARLAAALLEATSRIQSTETRIADVEIGRAHV